VCVGVWRRQRGGGWGGVWDDVITHNSLSYSLTALTSCPLTVLWVPDVQNLPGANLELRSNKAMPQRCVCVCVCLCVCLCLCVCVCVCVCARQHVTLTLY